MDLFWVERFLQKFFRVGEGNVKGSVRRVYEKVIFPVKNGI